MLTVIEAYANSTMDEVERKNYMQLHSYFANNKDGLIPYHRRGLALPKPPEGKSYRRLGAIESNIFTILGNRMKGRRACWSIAGGSNLARILCRKHTGRLSGALENLDKFALPERYAAEIQVELSLPQRFLCAKESGIMGFSRRGNGATAGLVSTAKRFAFLYRLRSPAQQT